jgi:hypothetical protein
VDFHDPLADAQAEAVFAGLARCVRIIRSLLHHFCSLGEERRTGRHLLSQGKAAEGNYCKYDLYLARLMVAGTIEPTLTSGAVHARGGPTAERASQFYGWGPPFYGAPQNPDFERIPGGVAG